MAAAVIKYDLNGCLESEVIAAFLDRRLGDADRAEVAGHLSTCESCYFVFSEAAQTKPTTKATTDGTANLFRDKRVMWSSLTGLAVAATVVLAVSGVLPLGRSSAPELTALVAAVGTDRTI